MTFTHDPATGRIELANPTTLEGIQLVTPPKVVLTEDIAVAMAMRVMASWLDQRNQINWRQFLLGGPVKPAT